MVVEVEVVVVYYRLRYEWSLVSLFPSVHNIFIVTIYGMNYDDII